MSTGSFVCSGSWHPSRHFVPHILSPSVLLGASHRSGVRLQSREDRVCDHRSRRNFLPNNVLKQVRILQIQDFFEPIQL